MDDKIVISKAKEYAEENIMSLSKITKLRF